MNNSEKLALINKKVCQCTRCPELVENRSQTVFGAGNPDADIVFCGEGPGRQEDEQGEPFVGQAGALLNNILSACSWSRDNVYILNIIKCRPPNNRTPTDDEATNCRPYLDLQLKVINPRYIICLGAVAINGIIRNTGGCLSVGRARDRQRERGLFEYKNCQVDAKVLATYHPAYLLRNPSAKKSSWDDMQLLKREMEHGVLGL